MVCGSVVGESHLPIGRRTPIAAPASRPRLTGWLAMDPCKRTAWG
jgi:hypothetical protein